MHDLCKASLEPYGLAYNDHGSKANCNWQICIASPRTSDGTAGNCLIQLVPDGPFWYAEGWQMDIRRFGDVRDNPPVSVADLEGPFVFNSPAEVAATFVLLGGVLPDVTE